MWRHNGHDGVSNHQPYDCLLNRLFGWERNPQSSAWLAFVQGNSPVTDEFPAQMASYAENASIWWRHHVTGKSRKFSEEAVILSLNIINTTVVSQWAPWRVKSSASRLFAQPFVKVHIKENIKAPRHWRLWEDNVSIWWRHHVSLRHLTGLSSAVLPRCLSTLGVVIQNISKAKPWLSDLRFRCMHWINSKT